MDIDCFHQILLKCDIKNIVKFALVCKNFHDIITSSWELIARRDFDDIFPKNNETWLDFYKRRSIYYGQPITIGFELPQYNSVKKFISIFSEFDDVTKIKHKNYILTKNDLCIKNHENFILTKDNEAHLIYKGEFYSITHDYPIKEIYCLQNEGFYFLDSNNSLYKIINTNKLLLIKTQVHGIVIERSLSQLYYTEETGTYRHLHEANMRVFPFKILDIVTLKNIDYIIDDKYNLVIGQVVKNSKYSYKTYNAKVKKLSFMSKNVLMLLGLDNRLEIYIQDKLYLIDIINIESLGVNSFITKNGDLYYFDNNCEEQLLDTDVIDVDFISIDGEYGCYVKRLGFY